MRSVCTEKWVANVLRPMYGPFPSSQSLVLHKSVRSSPLFNAWVREREMNPDVLVCVSAATRIAFLPPKSLNRMSRAGRGGVFTGLTLLANMKALASCLEDD
jgi:hypothetical protein